jgi:hypothetical protein
VGERCRLTESVIKLPIKPQSVKHSLFLYEGSALFADLGPKRDILTHLWEYSKAASLKDARQQETRTKKNGEGLEPFWTGAQRHARRAMCREAAQSQ